MQHSVVVDRQVSMNILKGEKMVDYKILCELNLFNFYVRPRVRDVKEILKANTASLAWQSKAVQIPS